MTLEECTPGSLLVIAERGVDVMVELGNLLGLDRSSRKKKTPPWAALVTTIDPDSLNPIDSTWRAVDVQLEVVTVIASATRRRELRDMNRRVFAMPDGDVDPMTKRRPDDDEDIAF